MWLTLMKPHNNAAVRLGCGAIVPGAKGANRNNDRCGKTGDGLRPMLSLCMTAFSLLCADGKSNRRGRGAPQLMDPEGQKKNPAAAEQSHTKFLIFAAQYDSIK
ncbi:MAG: hypothetical protein II804_04235 [Clostridia bacterium]|nr:hypothetical protein [Clostridia bacterium]